MKIEKKDIPKTKGILDRYFLLPDKRVVYNGKVYKSRKVFQMTDEFAEMFALQPRWLKVVSSIFNFVFGWPVILYKIVISFFKK